MSDKRLTFLMIIEKFTNIHELTLKLFLNLMHSLRTLPAWWEYRHLSRYRQVKTKTPKDFIDGPIHFRAKPNKEPLSSSRSPPDRFTFVTQILGNANRPMKMAEIYSSPKSNFLPTNGEPIASKENVSSLRGKLLNVRELINVRRTTGIARARTAPLSLTLLQTSSLPRNRFHVIASTSPVSVN